MNFKGHLIAGTVTAVIIASAAYYYNLQATQILHLFIITMLFSLFPDSDVKSPPQQWFFRAIFVLVLYLLIKGNYFTGIIIALVALIPLLVKQKTWTHNLVIACIMPIVFVVAIDALINNIAPMQLISWKKLNGILQKDIWYIAACALGWISHILFDLQFKLLNNDPNHH